MKKILVPTDFSDCSRAAFERAISMSRELGYSIELIHVFELPVIAGMGDVVIAMPDHTTLRARDWMEQEAAKAMASFIADFDTCCVPVGTRIEPGRAEETILTLAREGDFDLIVMGTHGRTGLRHLFLGSVAENVVRLADCPVLTVKAKPRAQRRAS
jgi:nucleotide-binding universal stress UspA family protein